MTPLSVASGFGFQLTDKGRNAETGLDYLGARYMSAAQGRLMIFDPSSGGITPLDPQSWNEYSYVSNRQTRNVDIDGNWAREIHIQLSNYASKDYVSAIEPNTLPGRQSAMDSAIIIKIGTSTCMR